MFFLTSLSAEGGFSRPQSVDQNYLRLKKQSDLTDASGKGAARFAGISNLGENETKCIEDWEILIGLPVIFSRHLESYSQHSIFFTVTNEHNRLECH